ncbi:MAG: LamG domain-containing protein [Candidatus Sericytochromatia bacterium]
MKKVLFFILLNSFILNSCNDTENKQQNTTTTVNDNNIDKGLVTFLPFNGNTNDESSNKLNIQNEGAVLTKDRNGNENKAYSFDGQNSFIKIALDINPEKFKDLTISTWVKADKFQNRMAIISNDDGNFDRTIGIDERGGSESWSVFGGNCEVISGDLISPNQWTFLTVRYDQTNKTIDFFVNNKKISKNGCEIGSSEHKFFNIGKNPSFSEFFKGEIDEVRVYNRLLSDDEVNKLYSMK